MKKILIASMAGLGLLTAGATFAGVHPSARPMEQIAKGSENDHALASRAGALPATFQLAKGAENDHDTACTPKCDS